VLDCFSAGLFFGRSAGSLPASFRLLAGIVPVFSKILKAGGTPALRQFDDKQVVPP
jgi:hypothetical protein